MTYLDRTDARNAADMLARAGMLAIGQGDRYREQARDLVALAALDDDPASAAELHDSALIGTAEADRCRAAAMSLYRVACWLRDYGDEPPGVESAFVVGVGIGIGVNAARRRPAAR